MYRGVKIGLQFHPQFHTSLPGWGFARITVSVEIRCWAEVRAAWVNRAATALRQAADTLMRSRSYLGAQYRRLRTKLGAPKAITAMAHRLARLVYRMLKYGQTYIDKGTEYYEERFRQQEIQLLRKRATKLGLKVAEIHA